MDRELLHTEIRENQERLDRIEEKVDRIISILEKQRPARFIPIETLSEILNLSPKWIKNRTSLPPDDPAHIPSFRWMHGDRLYFRREEIEALFQRSPSAEHALR